MPKTKKTKQTTSGKPGKPKSTVQKPTVRGRKRRNYTRGKYHYSIENINTYSPEKFRKSREKCVDKELCDSDEFLTEDEILDRLNNHNPKQKKHKTQICKSRVYTTKNNKKLKDSWTCVNNTITNQNIDPYRMTLAQEDIQKLLKVVSDTTDYQYDVLNVELVVSKHGHFCVKNQLFNLVDLIRKNLGQDNLKLTGLKPRVCFYVNFLQIEIPEAEYDLSTDNLDKIPKKWLEEGNITRHVVAIDIRNAKRYYVWDCNGPQSYGHIRSFLRYGVFGILGNIIGRFEPHFLINKHVNFIGSDGIGNCAYYTGLALVLLMQNPHLTLENVVEYIEKEITPTKLKQFVINATYIADSF